MPLETGSKISTISIENYLNDAEIATIGKWVLNGMPSGDPSKNHHFQIFQKVHSQIGTLDLGSFTQSYAQRNALMNTVILFLPTNLTEQKSS